MTRRPRNLCRQQCCHPRHRHRRQVQQLERQLGDQQGRRGRRLIFNRQVGFAWPGNGRLGECEWGHGRCRPAGLEEKTRWTEPNRLASWHQVNFQKCYRAMIASTAEIERLCVVVKHLLAPCRLRDGLSQPVDGLRVADLCLAADKRTVTGPRTSCRSQPVHTGTSPYHAPVH